VRALIPAPTRELAAQIAANHQDFDPKHRVHPSLAAEAWSGSFRVCESIRLLSATPAG
jgi:superfamily II DNA/RNA helicase